MFTLRLRRPQPRGAACAGRADSKEPLPDGDGTGSQMRENKSWARLGRRGAIAIALLGTIGAVAVSLALAWVNGARLGAIVSAELSQRLAGQFSIAAASVRLPDAIELEGVTVRAPDGTTALTLAHLRGRLDVLALIRGHVSVSDLTADGADVLLAMATTRADAAPVLGLAAAFTPKGHARGEAPTSSHDGGGLVVEVRGAALSGLTLHLGAGVAASGGAPSGSGAAVTIAPIDLAVARFAYRAAAGGFLSFTGVSVAHQGSHAESDVAIGPLTAPGRPLLVQASAQALLELGPGIATLSRLGLVAPEAAARLSPSGSVTASGMLTVTTRPGAAPRAVAQAVVAAPELRVAGESLRLAPCAVHYARAQLHVGRCALSWVEPDVEAAAAPTRSLLVSGSVDTARPLASRRISAELARLPLSRLAASYAPAAPLPEAVSGHVMLTGAGDRARIALDLTATELPQAAARLTQGPVTIAGELESSVTETRVERLLVASEGLSVHAHGTVGHAGAAPLDLRLEATLANADPFLRRLALPLSARQVAAAVHLQGTPAAPRALGRVTIDSVTSPTRPALHAATTIDFGYDAGVLRIPAAAVNGPAVAAMLSGSLVLIGGRQHRAGALTAHARLDRLDAAALTDGAVRATVTGEGNLFGSIAAPAASADLYAAEVAIAGIPFGRARLRGSIDAARATLTLLAAPATVGTPAHAHAVADETPSDAGATPVAPEETHADADTGHHLVANATWDRRRGSLRGALDVTGLPLVSMRSLLPELWRPLAPAGTLSSRVVLGGTTREPAVRIEAALTRLSLGETPIGTVGATVRLERQTLEGRVNVSGDSGDLAAAGTYDVARRAARGSVTVRHLELAALAPWLPGRTPLGGEVAADLAIEGPLARPDQVSGTIRVHGVTVGDSISVADAAFTVSTAPDAGDYRVAGSLGGGLQLLARARLAPRPWLDARLLLADLSLERIWTPLAEGGVALAVSGSASVSYDLARDGHPWQSDAYLSQLRLTIQQRTLRAARAVRLSYDGTAVHVPELRLVDEEGLALVARGVVGQELDVNVSGTVPLAVVAAMVPQVAYATGAIQVQGTARGALTAPEVNGELTFDEPVIVHARALPGELSLLRGHFSLRSDSSSELLLRGAIDGEIEGGAFQVAGEAALAYWKPRSFDVSLLAQNLPFRTRELVVEANADVRLSGGPERATLGGRVDLVRGRYLKKFRLQDFNFVSREPKVRTTSAAQEQLLSRLGLDLLVTSDAALDVRVDAGVLAMTLQLDSDVQVTGTANDPVLEGRVATRRGTIQFPKASLDVTQGVVEFTPARAGGGAPRVELRAEGEVTPENSLFESWLPTYLVSIALSGTLEEMALSLEAQPELSRVDVLSLLVRGQPSATALSGQKNGNVDAALAFAGSQLTGPLSSLLTEQIERTLNLRLELGAELTTSGIRLTASQEVTRRLQIQGSYERGLGTTTLSTTAARARLLLTDKLFFEGSTQAANGVSQDVTQNGTESRLELKWHLSGE